MFVYCSPEWANITVQQYFYNMQYIEPHQNHYYDGTGWLILLATLYLPSILFMTLAVLLCFISTARIIFWQEVSDSIQIWHFTVALPTQFGGTSGSEYP